MKSRMWLATPLVIYALYLAALFAVQRRVIFVGWGQAASVVEAPAGWEAAPLVVDDDITVPTLMAVPTGAGPHPAVIFAHGNAEVIDTWPTPLSPYLERGYAVLLVEYPGYNGASGAPTERTIAATMVAAYDRLAADPRIDGGRIVGHGRSLGGGAIGLLARERALDGVILQSTFHALRSLSWRMGALPWLVRDPMRTGHALRDTDAPVLILHGTHDEVIPFGQSDRLLDVIPGAERITWTCGHNDCPMDEAYWAAIDTLLERVE